MKEKNFDGVSKYNREHLPPLKPGLLKEEDLKTYCISDTHFYHDNIVHYAGRPENHDELMLENWLETIGEDDSILHLGDLAMGKRELLEDLRILTGQKTILLGNHDRRGPRTYFDLGFRVIKKGFTATWKGWTIVFIHDPSQVPKLYPKHIVCHGHIHEKIVEDSRYINFSVEQIDYKPIWLPDVLNAKIEELSK